MRIKKAPAMAEARTVMISRYIYVITLF